MPKATNRRLDPAAKCCASGMQPARVALSGYMYTSRPSGLPPRARLEGGPLPEESRRSPIFLAACATPGHSGSAQRTLEGSTRAEFELPASLATAASRTTRAGNARIRTRPTTTVTISVGRKRATPPPRFSGPWDKRGRIKIIRQCGHLLHLLPPQIYQTCCFRVNRVIVKASRLSYSDSPHPFRCLGMEVPRIPGE